MQVTLRENYYYSPNEHNATNRTKQYLPTSRLTVLMERRVKSNQS